MHTSRWLQALLFAFAIMTLTTACDSDDSTTAAADTGNAGSDMSSNDAVEEILQIGDVSTSDATPETDPALTAAWPWLDMTSAGEVSHTASGDIYTFTIDASAGGINGRQSNAFVYLDLDTLEKLTITDLESASTNTSWDLAFKRTAIRTNSADSGPGDVEVARVTDSALADVTAAPADGYENDRSLDPDGNILYDPIGYPQTAFNFLNGDNPTGSASWYDYAMGATPSADQVYVIRNTDQGGTFKIQIDAWESGVYTLRLQAL